MQSPGSRQCVGPVLVATKFATRQLAACVLFTTKHKPLGPKCRLWLTCSQLIDTRHCEQDLWRLKYERLLIAQSRPSCSHFIFLIKLMFVLSPHY